MKLYKYSDNIYYTDFEPRRDRPRLGYIKGDKFSVAIDAGHSDKHVEEFYELLTKEGLPLPEYTIITHWHWDHSFGMHRVNGKTIASKKTNRHLNDFIEKRSLKSIIRFRNFDKAIRNEYPLFKKIIVVPSDIEYEGKMELDLGNVIVEIFEVPSPHTDDCTMIYLPKEKVIFLGDGICGEPPKFIVDRNRGEKIKSVLEGIDFDISIGGHWDNYNKEDLLRFVFDWEDMV